MKLSSFSTDKILKGLQAAKHLRSTEETAIRLLFSPKVISEKNFDDACTIYSHIEVGDFDTVVIVESHPGSAEKKLPMPSFKFLDTPLGRVFANDKLRNDFADEDDDFFIDDEAFNEEASIWHQLIMLQSTLKEFTVLSVQITDESPFIVKELAAAMEEILASKNVLVICCCDLPEGAEDELVKVLDFLTTDNISALMNYLSAGDSSVDGLGSFITGLLVAKKWNLRLEFPGLLQNRSESKNLLHGYAALQKHSIFQR